MHTPWGGEGGWSAPYNGLFTVYERAGISLVEVYERVGNFVILVHEKALKAQQIHYFYEEVKKNVLVYSSLFVLVYSHLKRVQLQQLKGM